jgi:hypothetical protein
MITLQLLHIKNYHYLQYVQRRQAAYNKLTEKSKLPMVKHPHNEVDCTTFVECSRNDKQYALIVPLLYSIY